ncbi:patatin-like phospholipase family protein [Nocardia sp. NPDC051570]|uniref:patatin-like phospholipase family protein n=1 Tax=Nocardia sp. NPDC051570 TaxID=3364324 RepID=UPI0037B15B1F
METSSPAPPADPQVTAVDITTGALHEWTRDGAAALPEAMAASTAVPGVLPPIPIDGHSCIDGGIGSSINARLAADADLVTIIESMTDEFSRLPTDQETSVMPHIARSGWPRGVPERSTDGDHLAPEPTRVAPMSVRHG